MSSEFDFEAHLYYSITQLVSWLSVRLLILQDIKVFQRHAYSSHFLR